MTMDDGRWTAVRLDLLYLDDEIVAVNKPVGLSVHAAWPDLIPNDVVGILKAQLGQDYLGTHQRLDRDTSGVLVFARRPSANAWLATAFAERAVRKEYLAVVFGVPNPPVGRIDAPLVEGKAGRMLVSAGKGQSAQTDYEVLQTSSDRRLSLVRLRLLTGRTHQARVHLAHLGAPVRGDPLYDPQQRPFPRLLLHAHRLTLPTPAGPLTIEAPVPEGFTVVESSLKGRESHILHPFPTGGRGAGGEGLLLRLAADRRRPLAQDTTTTAYRLAHGEGDGFPNTYIDRLGDNLLLSLHTDVLQPPGDLLDGLQAVYQPQAIFLRYRPRQASRLSETELARRAPSQPIRGGASAEWSILENGLTYLIQMDAGLSVGLFLDMRETRARVRALAHGRTVLNLFAYTCGFGVAAVAGGATRVLNLDISRRWLDWGMDNYRRNGFQPDTYDFVDGDVFDWLRRFTRRRQTFDLVILDPPSFATTRTSRFSAERDWPGLAQAAAQVVAPGGFLLVCSNHAGLARAVFREQVLAGANLARSGWAEQGYWAEPALDFPTPTGQPGYLKILLLRSPD